MHANDFVVLVNCSVCVDVFNYHCNFHKTRNQQNECLSCESSRGFSNKAVLLLLSCLASHVVVRWRLLQFHND